MCVGRERVGRRWPTLVDEPHYHHTAINQGMFCMSDPPQ